MPNHCHCLFSIDRQEDDVWNESRIEGYSKPARDNIAAFIRGFKGIVTARARKELVMDEPIWQSRFHDHVVRNEKSFLEIQNYINKNPTSWQKDVFNQ